MVSRIISFNLFQILNLATKSLNKFLFCKKQSKQRLTRVVYEQLTLNQINICISYGLEEYKGSLPGLLMNIEPDEYISYGLEEQKGNNREHWKKRKQMPENKEYFLKRDLFSEHTELTYLYIQWRADSFYLYILVSIL